MPEDGGEVVRPHELFEQSAGAPALGDGELGIVHLRDESLELVQLPCDQGIDDEVVPDVGQLYCMLDVQKLEVRVQGRVLEEELGNVDQQLGRSEADGEGFLDYMLPYYIRLPVVSFLLLLLLYLALPCHQILLLVLVPVVFLIIIALNFLPLALQHIDNAPNNEPLANNIDLYDIKQFNG